MNPQRKIIHIDMDCFYAAIEMRDNPSLQHKPIAVGGDPSRRGVICTSNYLARQFGVRSAMASAYALKLCPSLVIIKPRMALYQQIALAIRDIFHQYTDLVEPLSLDEAFVDVSACEQHNGSATLIAQHIRQTIQQQHGLTASAGIAANKFLAKIASEWRKPNGQFTLPPQAVAGFMLSLPVSKIFGVGKVTAKRMHQLGWHTCGDLQKQSQAQLVQHFGQFGAKLFSLCRGIDQRPVQPTRERKSVSVEHTFANDLSTAAACLEALHPLMQALQQRLAQHSHRQQHKQFIKIKFADFQQTSVEATCQHWSPPLFESLLYEGLKRHHLPVRLLGIGIGFNAKEAKKPHQTSWLE